MAGISTVGGIVIPISIVRTGDKNAIKKLQHDINGLTSVVTKSNKNIDSNKTRLISWNKQLNALRWTMVNVTFAMTAIAGLAMPWILATKNAAAYEDQLVKIQSVTAELPGITSATILGAKAGRPFAKTDVAAGYLEFSKAGFTAEESASALNSILDLSVVGFMNVNDAAQLTAQMIRAFNLEASDASHIMDVMSNVADNSKIDVDGLGVAMGFVATVAQSAGQTLEDTAAILGVLADAGLNNSKAGTSLRQTIAALIDPSEKAQKAMKTLGISFVDSQGNIKQMTAFLEELKRSLVGLDPGRQQELLGQMFEIRALAGVSAAINRLDDLGGSFDGILESAEASGTAMVKAMQQQESAVNQMKTATEAFKDAFTGTGNVMLERTETITKAMTTLGSVVGAITEGMAKGFVGATEGVGAFFASLTVGLATVGGLLAVGLTGPFALIAAGIAGFLGVGAIFGAVGNDIKGHSDLWAQIGAEIKASSAETNAFIGAFSKVEGLGEIVAQEFGDAGSAMNDQFVELERLTAMTGLYEEAIRAALQVQGQARGDEAIVAATAEVERLKIEMLSVEKNINATKLAIVDMAEAADMSNFIAGILEANNAAITLDSSIKNIRDSLDEGIFDKLLGIKKFTQTSEKILPFIANLKNGIESIKNIVATEGATEVVSNEELLNLREASILLDAYGDSIVVSEEALQRLNLQKETEEGLVKNAKVLYNDERKELQGLNSEYADLVKNISKLSGARFKNETKTLNVLSKVNNMIKQQELNTLGVADANQFIIDSLKLETGDYDTLLSQIKSINNEMTNNTGSFEAWQQSIKEAILAEVEAGQTLGKDVSERVKTWQTALLGISDAGVGDGAESQAAEFANKLQLAYDVHFGGMQDEVGNFLAEQKDREIGVFDTSSQLIEALSAEIVKRDEVASAIVNQEAIVSDAFNDLEIKTSALNSTISQITDNEEDIKNSVTAISDLSTSAETFADGLVVALETINTKIANFLSTGDVDVEFVEPPAPDVSLPEPPEVFLTADVQRDIRETTAGVGFGGQSTSTNFNIENLNVKTDNPLEWGNEIKLNEGIN